VLDQVAEEIPAPEIPRALLQNPVGLIDLATEHTDIFPSKGEARKANQNNAVSQNKYKINQIDKLVSESDLLHGRYLLIENGKKNKYLVRAK
jgi:tyrosyl-tRNA synthetase